MSNIRFFAILALGLTAVHASDYGNNSDKSDKDGITDSILKSKRKKTGYTLSDLENENDNNNESLLESRLNGLSNNNFQNKERNNNNIKRYNNNQIPSIEEMGNRERIGQRRDDREDSEEGIGYPSTLKIPYLVTMYFTKTGKYLFGAACCVPLFFIIYLIYLQFSTEKASKAPATANRKA